MAETKIAWAAYTFNPVRGCTKVSPACANCYADAGSGRNPKVLGKWGPDGARVVAAEAYWDQPLAWDRRAASSTVGTLGAGRPRVFCASLGDIFERWEYPDGTPRCLRDVRGRDCWREAGIAPELARPFWPGVEPYPGLVPYSYDDARARLWALIRETPNLDWLLLTKRPENAAAMMPRGDWPNVWLGTTVESLDYQPRIDMLLDAAHAVGGVPVRFVSYEPALGPLFYDDWLGPTGVNWLIAGGESVGGREFFVGWAREARDACRARGAAFFLKQLGSNPTFNGQEFNGLTGEPLGPASRRPLPLADKRHGAEPAEWPADLRVREVPALA